jgi:hypothetical protein
MRTVAVRIQAHVAMQILMIASDALGKVLRHR